MNVYGRSTCSKTGGGPPSEAAGPSTVDGKVDAADVRRRRAAEEGDGGADLVGLPESLEGHGLGVSNTVRGAVANWAKTLANELGPDGITVNNVLPGATRTARLDQIAEAKSAKTGVPAGDILEGMAQAVPLKRLGEAHEIGAAIAFLCSPAAAYISGINLPVDGGRTRSL